MPSNNLPLVSCLCISHNSVELLSRSVSCFLHQTYPNKELVVVYTQDNIKTAAYLNTLSNPLIKKIEIPESTYTLGEKRNLAISECNGFYFCVWDDDDWYSNNRIEFQVQRLTDTQFKCDVLSQLLIFDSLKNEAYISAKRWAWEQTMLCEKSVSKEPALRYANIDRGEDSVFVFNLRENNLLLTISNPSLYIYVYHGDNTWHRKHWEDNIIRWGTKLSEEQSLSVKKILSAEYDNSKASEILEEIVLPIN
jgi:glycosyltransferase involved in cell wall biosynthesis